jgi:hypothetical protein
VIFVKEEKIPTLVEDANIFVHSRFFGGVNPYGGHIG